MPEPAGPVRYWGYRTQARYNGRWPICMMGVYHWRKTVCDTGSVHEDDAGVRSIVGVNQPTRGETMKSIDSSTPAASHRALILGALSAMLGGFIGELARDLLLELIKQLLFALF